jgi:hypothetical protein
MAGRRPLAPMAPQTPGRLGEPRACRWDTEVVSLARQASEVVSILSGLRKPRAPSLRARHSTICTHVLTGVQE